MWRYILKRLVMMIFVVLGVAILIFSIMQFVPGDPAQIILGTSATPEQIAHKRAELGLDKPYIVQLGCYLRDTFLKFDLGTSYKYGTPIIDEMATRFPRTLLLAIFCIIFQTVTGLPLGITAAVNQGKWQDVTCIVISMLGMAIPGFWLALMLVLVFNVKLGWLPGYGIDSWKCWILPILSTSLGGIAMISRQARSAMLEVIRSDFVTTARAKGVSKRNVIYKHALPNALIPIITMIGGSFASALGGTIIAEAVFSMPGVGMYMTTAINALDYPVVRSSVVLLAISFSIIMLITDLVYAFVDPRIKAEYTGK